MNSDLHKRLLPISRRLLAILHSTHPFPAFLVFFSIDMTVAYLIARKLLGGDDGDDKDKSCPVPPTSLPSSEIKPVVGSLSFHSFATILAGSCGILTFLIILTSVIRHATHYSNPIQQRQVIRILMLVPWVALFSFLTVWQEDIGEYLIESLDFGCSIAISAFLLLLCDLVMSNPDGFDELFGKGASKSKTATSDSPTWLKVYRTYIHIAQMT